jgi:hypothetical protein
MLDQILSALDLPRQAAVNFGRGLFGDDPVSALPGMLGMLGSLGLAASGVGLPLALLGGSLAGGATQAGGLASGNKSFLAPTSEEVAKSLGLDGDFLSSLIVGAATDPLTYIGGIGGARAGARMGKGLEPAAIAAGPGYRGGDALIDAIRSGDRRIEDVTGWANQLSGKFNMDVPALRRIAGEIPEGSTFLGSGMNAVAMKTPAGEVIRVGPGGGLGRPIADSVLPATRTVDVPGSIGMRVERSPLAELHPENFWNTLPTGKKPGSRGLTKAERSMSTRAEDLDMAARRDGLRITDAHEGNFGTIGGSNKIIDPGAFEELAFTGARSPVIIGKDEADSLLLRMLGARKQVREELEGRGRLDLATPLARMGAGVGTIAPIAARATYS